MAVEDQEPSLSIEPIVGLRAWGILGKGGWPGRERVWYLSPAAGPHHDSMDPRQWLVASIEETPWGMPGWTEAKCDRGEKPGTPHQRILGGIPILSAYCMCGLWAVKEVQSDLGWISKMDRAHTYDVTKPRFAFGEVELAGNVTEHELGYRAQRGRVKTLYDLGRHQPIMRRLAQRYEVPLKTANSFYDRYLHGQDMA